MSAALLTGGRLLETRREGRCRGYPDCCVEHFTGLLERGVLPLQHMGRVIAKRRRSRRAGMSRLAECVPCPAHRDVPPPGWAWVPKGQDTPAKRTALLGPPEVEP